MSPFEQVRRGLGHVWDSVAEGWENLRDRAAQALTRFNPRGSKSDVETAEQQLMQRSSRWAVLAADMRETERDVIVSLEVPGMERDDFDISVVDDMLVVQGDKRLQREYSEGRYHVMECAYGSFQRAIPLPTAVDESKAKARYRHGVLEITLPKSKAAARKTITVESE